MKRAKTSFLEKEMDLNALQKQVAAWRLQNLSICFTNGCFDILHLGHVTYIEKASEQADRMIIGAKEPPATMCSIHPDEALKHFCNDCNILVCGSCVVQHHNGHSLTTTGDAVGVHRTAIEALMAQVVVSRTHAIAAADAIKIVRGELEGNRDAAFKLVDEEAAKKRALLNTMLRDVNPQRDALKALIKGAHDEKYDALSAQIDALDDIESNSELALALVTATLTTASPAELLARKQTFVDGLMQFKEHKVALRRCRISKIGVVLDTSFAEKAADHNRKPT